MTNAASSISSVIATWKTCLETSDMIDSRKEYDIEHEGQLVKLDTERMRLLMWGNAVGLGDAGHDPSRLDSRLQLDDVRSMVTYHLRGIRHVIEHADSLGNTYGLRPATPRPTQSQRTLGAAFKRAYGVLRKSARGSQQETPLPEKRMWVVHDKKEFQIMVDLIKNFNDGLEDLFPREKTIGDATVGDLSLGATPEAAGDFNDKDNRGSYRTKVAARVEGMDGNLLSEVETVEDFVSEKSEGCLVLCLLGPYSHSARVTTHVNWDGRCHDNHFPREDEVKGSMKSAHASFDLYNRKRYAAEGRDQYNLTDEDYILFDVESNPLYENENPGTVTAKGFGMECWSYEELHGKLRVDTVLISCHELPNVPGQKLLRRADELRRGEEKIGWHREKEDDDLEEFFGNMGVVYFDPERRKDNEVSDLMSVLNRTDAFHNFTNGSEISLKWTTVTERQNAGLWNMLWQMILAKEVALRLQRRTGVSLLTGFTSSVLASLIVQDLWFRNVEVVVIDAEVPLEGVKRAETPEDAAKAERFNKDGTAAIGDREYQRAFELYSEALKIDLANPVYWCNRAAAFLGLEEWEKAETDAYYSTQFDPTYAKAWSRLGAARLGRGLGKHAKKSFQRAIELAGDSASTAMKQGLEDAKEKIEADLDAIDKEDDRKKKIRLRKKYLDRDWDFAMKNIRTHSLVHEQQVEGLLVFAEKMKWPYINELRDFAEEVYGKAYAGQTVHLEVYDWLFGLTLPGKWMSMKIMSVLVLCTPSIADRCGAVGYYDCGLSLRRKSYWRSRTVLGRVLGCLPGVTSLCGWIGPCPPIELDPPPSDPDEGVTRYARVRARAVAPQEHISDGDDLGDSWQHDRYEAVRRRQDDDMPAYLTEMRDSSKWFVPEPPVRDLTTVTVKSIRLKKLPLEVSISSMVANGTLSAKEANNHGEYRASIVFAFDNNEAEVAYTLYTNPVFVAPPTCRPGSGGHEVHMRERANFQRPVWTLDRLKAHTPEDFDGGVMVINVTGEGAEALARAWCSERSKNAVVRRAGGPCYVCAVRAAARAGLGVGVLIWVS